MALELGVDRWGLARWQEKLDPEMLRTDPRREKALVEEVEQLKKALAEKVLEVDFLPRCLAQGRGATERKRWRTGVYDQIGEVMRVQDSELEEGKSASGLGKAAVVSCPAHHRHLAHLLH